MMLGGVKICSTNTGNLDALLTGKGKIVDSGKLDVDVMNEMIDVVLRDNGECHDDKAFHYEWYNTTMKNKKYVMKQSWEIRVDEWLNTMESAV
jgi:hypothetical protein